MNDEMKFIPQMEPWFDVEEKDALSEYMGSGGWVTEFKKTKEFSNPIVMEQTEFENSLCFL